MNQEKLFELIAEALGVDLTGEEHISIVYPSTGGTISLSTGEHVFNLQEGKTYLLPNGAQYSLSNTLREGQFGRSVTIWSDQDITFRTDTEPQSIRTIDAHTHWNIEQKKFRKIFIKTTTSTNFKIWVSTHPTGAPHEKPMPAVDVTSGGMKVATGTPIEGYFQNDEADLDNVSLTADDYSDALDLGGWDKGSILLEVSAATDVTIEASTDNDEWFFYNVRSFATDSLDGLVKLDRYARYFRLKSSNTVTITAKYNVVR